MYAGLLVLSNIKHARAALTLAEKYVNRLYVQLNVPAKCKNIPVPGWSRLVNELYLESSRGFKIPLDMRVLIGPLKDQPLSTLKLQQPLSYLFTDSPPSEHGLCEELRKVLNIQQETIHVPRDQQETIDADLPQVDTGAKELCTYYNVVLGGTFDRIHLGHKIFLSAAVLRAKKRLVVGVTVNEMNKSKTLSELILPVDQRIAEVRDFLMEIDNTLQYDILPIEDGLGPTKSDPNMDMLVVSAETERGGVKVNETRAKNNLKKLDIHVVKLVEDDNKNAGPRETKVSSSNRRLDLLGTRLQKPQPKPHLPGQPYVIGLAGGIGSGKSTLTTYFAEHGAAIFNCDLIAHEIYEPGQVAYEKIVEHFGERILNKENRRIDRQALGSIVFSNKVDLEQLNGIVWPELIKEVKKRIQTQYEENPFKVAIVEAAILLQAGWEEHFHEVWCVIVPPEEAVERIMKRNSLSGEEARKRVSSQPTTHEMASRAHVLFSNKWDAQFTQVQAARAWQMLMTELSD